MQRDEITLVNHFKMDCIIYFYIQTQSRHFASTTRPDSGLRNDRLYRFIFGVKIFTTCKEFSIRYATYYMLGRVILPGFTW